MKKGVSPNKKPDITTRVGKYFLAVKSGVPKGEAQRRAGFAMDNKSTQIEKSGEFQALTVYFKDAFIQKMTMDEVSDYLIDNIKQEGQTRVDRNARNGAIKIALEQISPVGGQTSDTSDRVLIVLSK